MYHSKIFCALIVCVLLMTGCGDETPVSASALPKLIIADTTIAEGDEDQTISIAFKLSEAYAEPVIMNYFTRDSSALAGNDYEAISDGQLVFAPNEVNQSININIAGDIAVEDDEAFIIQVSQLANATVGSNEMVVTLANDDEDLSKAGELKIPTTGYQSATSYEGMSLVWQDEFDGAVIDANNWKFEIGDGCPNLCGWGNSELQYYREENASIVDGNLVIEAKKESFGNNAYTSARMITNGLQAFQYGRVDIRANLPYGQGVWPALWMLGENIGSIGWPACGEIDIMEMIGGDADGRDNTVFGTIHFANANNQHQYIGQSYALPNGVFADEFHVFSLEWTEEELVWLVDDQEFYRLSITESDRSEFHEKFFFIFNIAVGGIWPGNPDLTTVLPQYMVVDYIRVFQKQ